MQLLKHRSVDMRFIHTQCDTLIHQRQVLALCTLVVSATHCMTGRMWTGKRCVDRLDQLQRDAGELVGTEKIDSVQERATR